MPSTHLTGTSRSRPRKGLLKLSVGALGVVFGDIGTSPLYALKETFRPAHGLALTNENIYGILSLVFWSLTLVIVLKYICFILRADNHGEGGITALLALLIPRFPNPDEARRKFFITFLGLLGAGLLFGEGVITPAISVLSAIEGLEVATPAFKPVIVPLTVAILLLLFSFQRGGTTAVAKIFGPITLVWFLMITAMGLPWIYAHPEILKAVNPMYAIHFFMQNGMLAFYTLSSVVLCITGAEALYADMGHFGKKPIRLAWMGFVFPALLINYFGQGALVIERGEAVIDNTFYGMISGWLLYPAVVIATMAAVVASQALISGAFSLTQQTVQLGYLPRMTIKHTSRETEGQIYIPRVNRFLMVACISLVLGFGESSRLAAAYGIAVTGTMVITTLLFFVVTRRVWGWSFAKSAAICSLFMVVDLAFFSANWIKIPQGGYIPLLIALPILTIMLTWKRGREILSKATLAQATPLEEFFAQIERDKPHRIRGTAVFMTLSRDIAPSVLLHHYKHNQVLHERVILLSIITEHSPEVASTHRVRVTDLSHGFVKVVARYGYIETPDAWEIITSCEGCGLQVDPNHLSFYLGREVFVTTGHSGLPIWRKELFVLLSKNARSATEFFNLPPDRVIEIGSQIQI